MGFSHGNWHDCAECGCPEWLPDRRLGERRQQDRRQVEMSEQEVGRRLDCLDPECPRRE